MNVFDKKGENILTGRFIVSEKNDHAMWHGMKGYAGDSYTDK